ncbi:MAG: tetratricopeptide repeat protein, partial [Nitrososphaeraceae archaeon]|nr:tetratricopeptide repeat protein [Nitrososphaeraceae archaeon]
MITISVVLFSLYTSSIFDIYAQQHGAATGITAAGVSTLINKAAALNRLGNYTQAIQFYDKALAIDPNNEIALYGKGEALNGIRNYT